MQHANQPMDNPLEGGLTQGPSGPVPAVRGLQLWGWGGVRVFGKSKDSFSVLAGERWAQGVSSPAQRGAEETYPGGKTPPLGLGGGG